MDKKIRPVPFTWSGHVMVPHPRFKSLCNNQYNVDDEYVLSVPEYASAASRNHYFAALHDAWLNLREEDAKRFPTSEHLRKWCLVHAGFADERTAACNTVSDARLLAATVRVFDSYAVITRRGKIVRIYTAKSQSRPAMSKEEFAASKDAVLGIVSEMIGVTRGVLTKEAGRAA